ncbi:MAG: TonB-dependent receptor, partial [Kangiellaceae bacterium]|nr:TonB-dependent receptor [Kangiellaceae bacterium]
IVVKSQFREDDLQSTAASMVVLLNEQIQQREAQHLDDVLRAIGNVNFNAGANRGRFVQIRGIGERSQFQDPINPSVAFFIDGIDFSGVFGGATLFDVAQLEVIRGPQGSRFGASALAGAIYVQTEAADADNDYFNLNVAEQSTGGVGFATGGELTDNAALRVAINQFNSDGFFKNSYSGRDDTNGRNEFTSRIKVSWQETQNLKMDFAWHYLDIDNGYDAFSLDNNRTTRSDQPGFDRQFTNAYSLQGNYSGNESSDLIFSLAYSDSEIDYGYDEDWTFVGFHPDEYSSFDRYFREKKVTNGEIRWVSNDPMELFGFDTDWVVGIFAKQDREDLTRDYTFLTDMFRSDFQADTQSVFAELKPQLTDNLQLALGVRYERRDVDYRDATLAEATVDDMRGGHLSLNYSLSDDSLLYGLFARGFKAGGINPQINLNDDLRSFGQEKNDNFELGYKQHWDSGSQLRVALFRMERENQQTRNYFLFTRPDNSQEFIGYTGNVAAGINQGAEIEFVIPVNGWLTLQSSLGYLDTELDQIFRQDGSTIFGREQAQAPSYTYHFLFDMQHDEHWFSNLTFEGKDSEFFSDTHDEQSVPVDIVNFRVGYRTNDWQWTVWARNLTNEDFFVRGFGGFGNDPRDGYSAKPYYQLADPRQIGMSFNVQF